MKNHKIILIAVGTMFTFMLMSLVGIQSARNKAIGLEEAVYTAESDIKVQEKRRMDLVCNLADSVQQYDRHESETLKELADGMGSGNQIEDVNTALAAVTYAYPELKSNENYKQLMNELSITENKMLSTEKTIVSRLKPTTDMLENFRPQCSLIGLVMKSRNLNGWIIRHPAMHRRICLKSDIMDTPTHWRKR